MTHFATTVLPLLFFALCGVAGFVMSCKWLKDLAPLLRHGEPSVSKARASQPKARPRPAPRSTARRGGPAVMPRPALA
ncbi:hypothetical protein [uncultured Croceicoccus sp.]|uniref:hypothetical protein n=1 Tax=uncultured Croceicoccus sp. TaxID=1295329 RepID=UPI0026259772|nr:hypothetical protein [uncultured Croceicoccus sp.]